MIQLPKTRKFEGRIKRRAGDRDAHGSIHSAINAQHVGWVFWWLRVGRQFCFNFKLRAACHCQDAEARRCATFRHARGCWLICFDLAVPPCLGSLPEPPAQFPHLQISTENSWSAHPHWSIPKPPSPRRHYGPQGRESRASPPCKNPGESLESLTAHPKRILRSSHLRRIPLARRVPLECPLPKNAWISACPRCAERAPAHGLRCTPDASPTPAPSASNGSGPIVQIAQQHVLAAVNNFLRYLWQA